MRINEDPDYGGSGAEGCGPDEIWDRNTQTCKPKSGGGGGGGTNCGGVNCIAPMVCVQREWGPNCEDPNKKADDGRTSSTGPAPTFKSATTQFKAQPIDLSPFTNPNWTQINQIRDLWLKDPQYQQALRNVGALYSMFGVKGAESYGMANDYWRSILSGGKGATGSFLAPMYSNLSAQTNQARNSIMNNASLRGGARDAALRDLNTSAFSTGQGFLAQAQPQAANALGQLGIQGGQIGQQASQDYAQLTQAPFLSALQGDFQNRSLGANLAVANQQSALGFAQLNGNMILGADQLALNSYLGQGQLDLGYYTAGLQNSFNLAQLQFQKDTQAWQQNTYFPMMMQLYQQQMIQQQKAQNASKWGSLLGAALQAGGTIGGSALGPGGAWAGGQAGKAAAGAVTNKLVLIMLMQFIGVA